MLTRSQARAARRLPGFHFEVQSPPPADILPRLDVACFAGFAASGPLNRPVAVESAAQFEMIFGADIALAWDEARGEPVSGYLAPAVRAFFRNGGRRAWVLRLAGTAQSDYFAIPGLLQASFAADGQLGSLQPAYALARSPGSWADRFRAGAALLARTLDLSLVGLDPPVFKAKLTSPQDLAVGDLLRVTFDSGTQLFCTIRTLDADPDVPGDPRRVQLVCDQAVWMSQAWRKLPLALAGEAVLFDHNGPGTAFGAALLLQGSPLSLDWPGAEQPGAVRLELDLDAHAAPQPGSLLRLELGGELFWLLVEETITSNVPGSPPVQRVKVSGQGFWQDATYPDEVLSIDLAERLAFELWARGGSDQVFRISELTFDLRHPRCWDRLPNDLDLYPGALSQPGMDSPELWAEAGEPRFPLAGSARAQTCFIPLAMPVLPEYFIPAERPAGDALQRDGLDALTASIFLDGRLADVGVNDLINEADQVRAHESDVQALTGIHAVLDIDEVTLLAVPDAVQRGWLFRGQTKPADPQAFDPPLRPEWWHFEACDPQIKMKPVHEPEWGNFLNCDIRIITAPVLSCTLPDAAGSFVLEWTRPEDGLVYHLEEAARSDFVGAVVLYQGPEQRFEIFGHNAGIFYYRVRAWHDAQSSDWSNGKAVSVLPHQRWTLLAAQDYDSALLLQVQHAMLRLCAARSDLFALLSLPEHYREGDAIAHSLVLRKANSGFFGPESPRTLSFGALYHPWLIGREENRPSEFRRTPPDGAIAGSFARRTLAKGAWLAPANELLKGVVALVPLLEQRRWLDLQEAQLNIIRHEARGFAVLNNDTLSDDEDLRAINVRRLLILLRRLALREGANYIFEPNNPAFRRSVQRGFEALLDLLYQRGAFAGGSAGESFQVVTGPAVNTDQLNDQGIFVIELRVAPSLPMRFLTIRLVQTGDRTAVMSEQ